MKKFDTRSAILRGLYHYVLFFLLVAFLVSSTMILFVSTLSDDLGITLTGENLSRAAKLTFLNVLLLSVLLTAFDILRRKLTTERITGRIAAATKEIVKGNFDVRIPQSTARLVLDEKYSEIIDCFNKMAGELGSLETLRTDFIANVSHEMKTPLAVMQNYGTLLQAPDLPEEKRLEYAKGVTDGARRLADMMTNILKLNRLENQQIFPQVERFDLGEQLCESILQYENVWETAGIEIDTDIAEDVTVQGDRELLALVWNNLLSNAFKFTPSGGTVSVSLTADEAFAAVRVQDTGCGMSAEVGAHIFEKFYQGDMSHATQGNGLGLALVKRVVDILKGEISVESTVGVGSTFTVKIRRT
mgnify:FL=1